jgi:Xaa-Pro dipeptidase
MSADEETIRHLLEAQAKAEVLFAEAERLGLLEPGQTESRLSDRIYDLAHQLHGTRRHWHKRIVRSGPNTLLPYREPAEDRVIAGDDILFFDFGPVFEQWEADFGRTYVLGDDREKQKLRRDVEAGWHEGLRYCQERPGVTGVQMYSFTLEMARRMGWEYGGPHCGHLIGRFPHERIIGDEAFNYLHPGSDLPLRGLDKNGQPRHWIYEIHFVNRQREIGGFFEQLLL